MDEVDKNSDNQIFLSFLGLLTESNTLFGDMVKKLDEYPELKRMLYMILFRGEQQLIGYLDDYHLTTGYMVSFNFNRKKQVGVKRIQVDGRTIVEAVV